MSENNSAPEKINVETLETEGRFHSNLPDVPALTATEMKAFFDYIAKYVLIPKVNDIIDELALKADTVDLEEVVAALALKADAADLEEVVAALTLKANAADVYRKSNTYNKNEVNSALTGKQDKITQFTFGSESAQLPGGDNEAARIATSIGGGCALVFSEAGDLYCYDGDTYKLIATAADLAAKADADDVSSQFTHIEDEIFNINTAKLDKGSTERVVYATDGNGDQTLLPYSYAADEHSIARRGSNGALAVGNPIGRNYATPKGYVDDELALKADASTVNGKLDKDSAASRVYATDANGDQTTLAYDSEATHGAVVVRDNNGRFKMNASPSNQYDVVNKRYVDAAIAAAIAAIPTKTVTVTYTDGTTDSFNMLVGGANS